MHKTNAFVPWILPTDKFTWTVCYKLPCYDSKPIPRIKYFLPFLFVKIRKFHSIYFHRSLDESQNNFNELYRKCLRTNLFNREPRSNFWLSRWLKVITVLMFLNRHNTSHYLLTNNISNVQHITIQKQNENRKIDAL